MTTKVRSEQQIGIRRAVQRIEEAIMRLRIVGEMAQGDRPWDPEQAVRDLDGAFTELCRARHAIERFAGFAPGRSVPIEIRGGKRRVIDAIHAVHSRDP